MMAKSLNVVQLIGNLGKDPVLNHTPGGVAVCSCSLATTESWKDKDGNWQDNTQWHRLVIWRELAERFASKFEKGDTVFVSGKLEYRTWKDKNGVEKETAEINVDKYVPMSKRGETVGSGQAAPTPVQNPIADGQDDIPF